MEALIPLCQTAGGNPAVSARDLHQFLESRQEFTTWIKDRLAKYGFIEGTDFLINLSRSPNNRQTTEYVLSLDTAKELAMVEANAKGQQARRYFIEAERALRAQTAATPQLTTAEMILQLAQQSVEAERRLVSLEQQLEEVKAKALTTNTSYYTIAGYASLHRRRLTPTQANAYGRTATALSKHCGCEVDKIHDARYGQVNAYHVEVLKQVFRV
jgi:anti-repressor protein